MSDEVRDVSRDGGCACGAVRFRLKTAPMIVHCCHCLDCQKETGGAFVINALIETDRIEFLEGAPRAVSMRALTAKPPPVSFWQSRQ